MKRFLGLLLSVVMLTGVLAGCAKTPAGNNETSTDSTPSVTEPITPDNAEKTAFPITYTDSKGKEITIASKPERIALTYYPFVDNMASIGYYPIATLCYDQYISVNTALQPYIEGREMEDLGTWDAINLEKLAAVEPDLILAADETSEKVYDQLTKIAPVVFFDAAAIASDWRYGLRELSKVFGEEEKAEAVIADLESKITEAKETLAPYSDESAAFMGLRDKGFAMREHRHLKFFYDELGLKVPDNLAAGMVTLEGLAELNPDHIFLFEFANNPVAEQLKKLEKESVWNSLTAVKNGNVHIVDNCIVYPNPISLSYGIDLIIAEMTK